MSKSLFFQFKHLRWSALIEDINNANMTIPMDTEEHIPNDPRVMKYKEDDLVSIKINNDSIKSIVLEKSQLFENEVYLNIHQNDTTTRFYNVRDVEEVNKFQQWIQLNFPSVYIRWSTEDENLNSLKRGFTRALLDSLQKDKER